jgi:oligoribonuclease NrnB/cAMP/cGMP phosphodiesterase (DHH superfamily)
MVRLRHGDAAVSTLYTDPSLVTDKLRRVAEARVPGEGRSLLLSDVSPQLAQRAELEQALGQLNELGWRIEWRDHHAKQWEQGMLDAVRRKADHVRVSLDNDESGASLCQLDLLPGDAFARELAQVVRDVDLWIRKDPRSEVLTDARHAMGSTAWVGKMVRDRVVLDDELRAAAQRHRAELERDLGRALAKARVVHGARKVGVVYGDFPGSQACDALRRALGTDVELALKPDGKFSLRSQPGIEVHRIAQAHGGGGHPQASGGKLRVARAAWPGYWLARGWVPEARAIAEEAAGAR